MSNENKGRTYLDAGGGEALCGGDHCAIDPGAEQREDPVLVRGIARDLHTHRGWTCCW